MINGQLKAGGIRNRAVLDAFFNVPREWFVPPHLESICYVDEELETDEGRCLLAPALHARMIQEVDPEPEDVVLDIGGGRGYSPAIWSHLASTVIAVEEKEDLLEIASRSWQRTESYNVAEFTGKLCKGAPEYQPFDIIFINGAVPEPPEELLNQLKENGRLIAVITKRNQHYGTVVKFTKNDAGHVSSWRLFDAACPHLPEFMNEEIFAF